MCGICGFVSKSKIFEKDLIEMNNTMQHRGPDDQGITIENFDQMRIGLAQRRLSILDLSSQDHQPMYSEDKQLVIVFNGEIYNYKEIRDNLCKFGYTFRTMCDTEVLLIAYSHWGEKCLEHLNGMFAFVIYDKSRKLLFGARDRFGKKPFYYYYHNNEFVFASELKPIMKYPNFSKEINESVLNEYLYHGYIKAPRSIFKNVYKLQPGSFFVLKNENLTFTEYWKADTKYLEEDKAKFKLKDYEDAKKTLKNTIENAVKKRLIADVPIGSFLSGGIDSTLITAMAQKNTARPLKTYSIGFKEKENNEAVFAKKIAEYLGTEHYEMYIDENTMLELVDSIPDYYDEPFGDSSQIPTMLVSQLASKDITVALTGDGGDELFCGYTAYDKVLLAQKLDSIGGFLYKNTKNKKIYKRIPTRIKTIMQNRDNDFKTQFPNDLIESNVQNILIETGSRPFYRENLDICNWQERRMLLDMGAYLPDDILAKVDRGSMKYSLEARCPLLDYEVAELSFQIPHKYKYYKKEKKYILKDITYEFVPKKLLERPKKGFSVPLKKWLTQTYLSNELHEMTKKEFIEKQKLFEYKNLRKLINQLQSNQSDLAVNTIWNFFVFQKWYMHYMI